MGDTYKKFVLDATVKNIIERTQVSKAEAEDLFYKALASNLVQNEVCEMAVYLNQKEKSV